MPSVDAPLGDFFAVGHGLERPVDSLMIRDGSDGRARNSYWPMPFRKGCRITVTNEGSRFTGLYYHVDWQKMPSLPPDTAYFHARYRQLLPAPADGKPFVFLETKGRGFYAGTVQNIIQAEPGWYGEGDDMFYVDGEKLASIQGTGSEDYFNDAWGLHVSDGDYAGVTVADGTGLGSRMTAYRWHLTDPVPFTSSIRVEIEHKGWTYKPDGTVRTAFGVRQDLMSSVAYWYQEGIATDQPPVPYGTARLPQGNALQIELEEALASAKLEGGKTSVVEDLFWGKDVILFDAEGPGSRIELPFEVPEDGDYELIAQVAQASDYGTYEVWLDGKPPAPPGLEHEPGADIRTDAMYDGYAWETYVGKTVQLGWPRLTKGRHTVTFVCKGKRSESNGFKAGIDNLILARVGAAAWAKAAEARPSSFRPGDVPSLVAQLTNPDPVVRTLAACALRDRGAGGVARARRAHRASEGPRHLRARGRRRSDRGPGPQGRARGAGARRRLQGARRDLAGAASVRLCPRRHRSGCEVRPADARGHEGGPLRGMDRREDDRRDRRDAAGPDERGQALILYCLASIPPGRQGPDVLKPEYRIKA